MNENDIGTRIVEIATLVHRELGPGLLERVYEAILFAELEKSGLQVERQVDIPVVYCGIRFNEGFRADLIVHRKVIVEIKCIENLNYAHRKQLLTYLRLAELKLGYLLNFSEGLMKTGIIRIVNGLHD